MKNIVKHFFLSVCFMLVAFAPAVTAQTSSEPPTTQKYVNVSPAARVINGRTMVPANFLRTHIGAGVAPLGKDKWRIGYFDHTVDVTLGQLGSTINEKYQLLLERPQIINGNLYVPWVPLAELFEIKWSRVKPQDPKSIATVFLLQSKGVYIEKIRHSVDAQKVRVIYELSNSTMIGSRFNTSGYTASLPAARREGVPTVHSIGSNLAPRVVTRSGSWKATSTISTNYSAPIHWFTLGNPPRLVVDVRRVFDQSKSQNLSTGLSLTTTRKGVADGPVQMFVARVDPRQGWRMTVEPASHIVTRRIRTTSMAARKKAPVAINGGFFAFDGAAVGAVKVDNRWIRLPWKGRTAIGFNREGQARIANLQASAYVLVGGKTQIPIADLNGWPDRSRITMLTTRFRKYYKMRPGEIAAVVQNNKIVSTPGSGGVNIPSNGFVLVAGGGSAVQTLKPARKGSSAVFKVYAPGWEKYSSILGGGPRLVENGKVNVKVEGFRSDVTNGRGPRTAVGIDKFGRFILLVVDGRRSNYSIGMTLKETAFTLQKLGAVNAINLDGGGSTAMVVRNRVINRPSDGSERSVSNALLVTR